MYRKSIGTGMAVFGMAGVAMLLSAMPSSTARAGGEQYVEGWDAVARPIMSGFVPGTENRNEGAPVFDMTNPAQVTVSMSLGHADMGDDRVVENLSKNGGFTSHASLPPRALHGTGAFHAAEQRRKWLGETGACPVNFLPATATASASASASPRLDAMPDINMATPPVSQQAPEEN